MPINAKTNAALNLQEETIFLPHFCTISVAVIVYLNHKYFI